MHAARGVANTCRILGYSHDRVQSSRCKDRFRHANVSCAAVCGDHSLIKPCLQRGRRARTVNRTRSVAGCRQHTNRAHFKPGFRGGRGDLGRAQSRGGGSKVTKRQAHRRAVQSYCRDNVEESVVSACVAEGCDAERQRWMHHIPTILGVAAADASRIDVHGGPWSEWHRHCRHDRHRMF